MTIVRHPTLDVERDVPESKLAEWLAAGWLTDGPVTEVKTWGGDVLATFIETDGGQLAPTEQKPKKK